MSGSHPPGLRRRTQAAAACAAALAATLTLPAAGPAAVPPPPSEEFYGVSPATELAGHEYARIERANVRTLRVPFYWPHMQRHPDGEDVFYDMRRWDRTDELVRSAAENGMRVLPFVYGTPNWLARSPEHPPLDSRAARDAWQRFLRELVDRYGPAGTFWSGTPLEDPPPYVPITAWQIWNEQNSPIYWAPAISPARYAELLQLAHGAIASRDPHATVVLGGMFGTPAGGVDVWSFLRELYAVPGVKNSFDAYALHPYAPDLDGIKAQIKLVRRELRRAGDRKLPLWITELGWPTDGPADFELVQSRKGQKRMLSKSFRLILDKRRRWKIQRLVWYTWRDNDVRPSCSLCRFAGLFDAQLKPKPAWRRFARFTGGSP